MKSYLQRLAARGEGVAPTPSLIPTVRNPAIFHADTESAFTEVEGVVDSPAKSQSPLDVATPIESRPRRATLRAHHDDITAEKFITKNISVQPNLKSRATDSSRTDLPSEEKTSERSSGRSFSSAPPQKGNLENSREPNRGPNPITTSATKASAEVANDEQNSPVVAGRELAAPLEPRLVETPNIPGPIPDEPRLVIGQMRVDVVAIAAPKTQEVVRIVTRTDGSNNYPHVATPKSKLRFGLGQM